MPHTRSCGLEDLQQRLPPGPDVLAALIGVARFLRVDRPEVSLRGQHDVARAWLRGSSARRCVTHGAMLTCRVGGRGGVGERQGRIDRPIGHAS